jgi:hypothetical protein
MSTPRKPKSSPTKKPAATVTTAPSVSVRTLDQLDIEDEASFRHVPLYPALKQVVLTSGYRFRVLQKKLDGRWDRALFLNLTFWGASGDGDVLAYPGLPADVVAHVAWHKLAAKALARSKAPLSADALFFGEAIASAFDLYLVGRLLGRAPSSSFLATQVPAMAESAQAAGLSAQGFEKLLARIAKAPERAFEDLRALLFDVGTALVACKSVERACDVLAGFASHPYAPLLHRYELSNWVLYARAYAPEHLGKDPHVRAADRALRKADVSLDWLAKEWLVKGDVPEKAALRAPRKR